MKNPGEGRAQEKAHDLSVLIQLMKEKKLKLGLAESCTGGLLSAQITCIPGVSDFFMGSVVSYSNEVKQYLLGVKKQTLEEKGAVSIEAALEMALGAKRALKVDWSAAITGIAGPDGGTETKPVGTVCFAVVGPGFEMTHREQFAGDRQSVQAQGAEFAVKILVNALRKDHGPRSL